MIGSLVDFSSNLLLSFIEQFCVAVCQFAVITYMLKISSWQDEGKAPHLYVEVDFKEVETGIPFKFFFANAAFISSCLWVLSWTGHVFCEETHG